MAKYVYAFEEGKADMKQLLGGKGANLAEMTNLGIPVPPGFTITTEVCDTYNKNKGKYPEEVDRQVDEQLKKLEKKMNARFGDAENPLLVSVRSGAAVSMPGMMDTVLNLGLNDKSVEGFIKKTGNPRFVYDAYRRLINMFGDVVMGVDHHHFESILTRLKEEKGVEFDVNLEAEDWKKAVEEYKKVVKKVAGKEFPQEPKIQLKMAIDAVFSSWGSKRAIAYRQIHDIRGLLGTAVNVQTMVFGNMGTNSGTGVAFTRNPSTGDNHFYGEYLINAQGEDVVAGIRTPEPIDHLKKKFPKIYAELEGIYKKLEQHYKEMEDIEFTFQEGKLYMLQTRTGKRTAMAALKIAVDMVKEGLIDKKTAILRVQPKQLEQLMHRQLDPKAKEKANVIGKGLPASPGAAVGKAAFTADDAVKMKEAGEKVILVRTETSPEDIQGMNSAEGILTARGGMTSHAAVVARGMGKCCVAGCGDITVDESKRQFKAKDIVIKEGEWITLDGTEGKVFQGKIDTMDPQLSGDFGTFIGWADAYRRLGVKTNADTPKDCQKARGFGAKGVGLCRTEHMFFEGNRIKAVREMILAETEEERKKAINKLLPYQKEDFVGIFEAMSGLPVTIRLLDPPLHEFLPKEEKDIKEIAKEMKVSPDHLKGVIDSLHEFNPMLGFRGSRLGIIYPEIYEMQARAIIEAAIEVNKKGKEAIPQIMIPLIGVVNEAKDLHARIKRVADDVIKASNARLKYKIGTMIELPRACIVADQLAKELEFFSFGTNDLTQTTYGLSRDDAGKFIPKYIELGIFEKDPFQVLDAEGVGGLMKICIEKARKANPKIELGICGEHGGDPESVETSHKLGLDYVSCSPFRVPIARLAAAHAVLKEKAAKK